MKNPPPLNLDNLFGPSQRIPRWAVIVLALGLAFLIALFFAFRSCGRRPATAYADTSMAKVIPDDSLDPDLLSSMTPDPKKDVKIDSIRKEPASQNPQPLPYQPEGSMAIFVADSGGRSSAPLGVPMGTELSAVIEQSILAGAGGSPVVAKLASDFVKAGHVVIPKGSRVFGQASGSVENQLQVRFSRIVFPNGKDFSFSGVSAVEGYLKGKKGQRALAALSGTSLSSASLFLPSGGGYADILARGFGKGAADEAGRDISSYRMGESVPVISVRPNKKIIILVDKPI